MFTVSAASKSILALGILALSGCGSALRLPEERVVLELPVGVEPWWITVSPGGQGSAYAERRGSDAFLVFDGRRLGPFP